MTHKNFTELPETPAGWTKSLSVHMNFGEDGGAASYDIKDPDGNVAPFGSQYDTRKGGLTGFKHRDFEGVKTWTELREFMATQKVLA